MPEIILPGTYITVRDEGLITAGRVATGIIGIVGTAAKGPINNVQILGSFTEAREMFGDIDDIPANGSGELTLVRAIQQVYNNGGRAVYAVRTGIATGTGAATAATLMLKNVANDNLLRLDARSEGTWGNQVTVKVSLPDGAPANTTERNYEIVEGVRKERYGGNDLAALAARINAGSALVTATVVTAGNPAAISAPLAGGTNGVGATPAAQAAHYTTGLALLENDIINIVLLGGQPDSAAAMTLALQGHLNTTTENKRERIAVVGCNGTTNESIIAAHSLASERIVFVAPGMRVGTEVMSGAYTAAAVAGLLSSLPVQASPTNKTLAIAGLNAEYTASKLEKLVQNRVLVIEKREGYRIVKGITTATNSAWHQITTRRIVDYAIYGVRSACNPYIGKLNNERVRGAMKATLDAFLTRMVEDEALVSYDLEVSATRAQEIAGECAVAMTIRPTFSIDFVRVTMYLG